MFERSGGGRGARVRVSTPGYLTIIIADFGERAHGNIFPDGDTTETAGRIPMVAGHALLRLVPYSAQVISKLAAEVESKPSLLKEVVRIETARTLKKCKGDGNDAAASSSCSM